MIYIFSDVIEIIHSKKLSDNFDQGLTFLIYATFHELEHHLQHEHPDKMKNQNNYLKVIYNIEKIILMMRTINPEIIDMDYSKKHDSFFLEIDADIKGISNAKEFTNKSGIRGVNTRFYDLMDSYNNFRAYNYDIPLIINQFIKIVNKYPDLLSPGGLLSNNELASFFNKDGKLKSLEELRKINSSFTKYFITSEAFLQSNFDINMTYEQKMFVNECIKKIISEREGRDKLSSKMNIENVVKELSEYKLNPNSMAKSCDPMASKSYYDMLKGRSYLIEESFGQRYGSK